MTKKELLERVDELETELTEIHSKIGEVIGFEDDDEEEDDDSEDDEEEDDSE